VTNARNATSREARCRRRCLACHKPVAERIAKKKGVHREVTNDCVACHVEHAGRDAELRPFDPRTFDHRTETGFPLDGRHAPLRCNQCHKTRSYLGLSSACVSCHKDPHQGRLGTDCARCHSTTLSFRDLVRSFDHAKTAFRSKADIALPSRNAVRGQYKGVRHASCADCHRTAQIGRRQRLPLLSYTGGWKVANFDTKDGQSACRTAPECRLREVSCVRRRRCA
jgi:hypothetical protein